MANPYLSVLMVMLLGLGGCALQGNKPDHHETASATVKPTPDTLEQANQALAKGRFAEASALYTALSQQPNTTLQRQALTGLTLLSLSPENPDFSVAKAMDIMDQLNSLLAQDNDQQLLFGALKQLLENSVMLTRQKQLGVAQASQLQQLQARIDGLEAALERLRRISLQ